MSETSVCIPVQAISSMLESNAIELPGSPSGGEARLLRKASLKAWKGRLQRKEMIKLYLAALHPQRVPQRQTGRPREAIELFQAALELPGNGFMRFAGTVREYRCPSEGEEQAALYNMACAYAALRQRDSALACLEGAFEAGLSDFAAVRSDPDLSAVRGQDLDKLLSKYDNLLAKLFKKKEDDENKPWLGW
ncbi:hypothetical protein COCSUDRAFT_62492 [Coccomyxa subellipsoidea C-169]|uniref:Tetratricopeptide repeat protein n=1 Tax=Coccomyxa subellipsoidea (strain C-169) TaxID=574566 RepID=I0YZZ4_COCSC|nr:hypothetical protein COCSUDRAFT_62492 [Coccomyxa subellipsoidea C-169]EIE23963.1 hypothetical protein COCSUDRAFT_62492 [Coccomyxa subellipsoidea C-169]|eukprot:XP_005648507.1 hypothetical protein COCSUDRAFT_62492 [Coccomyxa subellipsoidea C-169]